MAMLLLVPAHNMYAELWCCRGTVHVIRIFLLLACLCKNFEIPSSKHDIKGTAMPTYMILAQVTMLVQVRVRVACGHAVTDCEIYLARPILAIPHQLSIRGSTVTQSWRQASSVLGFMLLLCQYLLCGCNN